MRKTREEKAITLIALIITIVVLLILAVVAINAVTGDGIIQHAVNAKTEYEKAQNEENSTLSYYEAYLNAEGQVGKWNQKEQTKTVKDIAGNDVQVKIPASTITKVNSDGTVINIPIGAVVNYNPTKDKNDTNVSASYTSVGEGNTLVKDSTTGEYVDQTFGVTDYTGQWKVLGIENGKVLLVSANSVKSFEMNCGQLYMIGENELNNICAIYGKGKGAESARSIKVEDVNKITGYNPETINDYDRLRDYGRYGVATTFSTDGTKLKYNTSEGEEGEFLYNALIRIVDNQWIGGQLNEGEIYIVKNNFYRYSGIYYSDDYINMKMSDKSNEFSLIYINESYWLASRVESNYNEGGYITNGVLHGLRMVNSGSKMINVTYINGATTETKTRGVRPVITLEANADLILKPDGSYDIKL